jgi:hypothetical protein
MSLQVRYKVLGNEEAEKALSRHYDPDSLMKDHNTGETVDVSRTGILMNTSEELMVKTYLNVALFITVPGISCNCKALAEVMRRDVNPDTDVYRFKVGLKFHKILHHNLKNYKFSDLSSLLGVNEQHGD